MNLTRYNLAKAILSIDPKLEWSVSPQRTEFALHNEWEALVRGVCFTIIARSMTGPAVDLVQRAARQIEQADEIQWDSPETPEEIAGEQPYLDIKAERLHEHNAKQKRKSQHYEKANLIELTEREKAKIGDLNYVAKLGDRIVGCLSSIPPEIEFCFNDLGFYWGGWVSESKLVNSLLRHGICELVKRHERYPNSALQAIIRTGPKYVTYLKAYRKRPLRTGSWNSNIMKKLTPNLLKKYDFLSEE